MVILALAMTILFVPEERPLNEATPVDWPGAVLIGGAVAVFVYGVLQVPLNGWSDPVVYGCLAGGIALAILFGFVELRRAHPLLDVRLFAKPDLLTGSIGMTTLFFAIFGFFFTRTPFKDFFASRLTAGAEMALGLLLVAVDVPSAAIGGGFAAFSRAATALFTLSFWHVCASETPLTAGNS